ncbi:hypothetical protein R1T08_26500 [Streptomyces sp. SBC-4]|nr:hypothetical protein [Streptomyces sp. SBC-4]MDV5147626.1 hypothetical protein [Streptomyces sp. SBC-4]
MTRQYWYRKSVVTLTVYAGKVWAPVTGRDLSDVAKDPRFLELVKEADARPVEATEPPFALKRVSPREVAELFSGKGQRAR